MRKVDYILVVIAMIIALGLFTVYQITVSPKILEYLVRIGILSNSKETLKDVILIFYSLMAVLFIVVAIFLIRILAKLFKG